MIQIRRQDFAIQSTLGANFQRSLVVQPPSELIVGAIKEQIVGNSFTLHPGSATPIAIRPLGGRAGSNNAPAILSPGATFYPGKTFDSFEWGLPFGWLGGGLALLYVGLDEHARFDFQSRRPEVLFHRVRLQIGADGAALSTTPNWPRRFPWPNATLPSGVIQGSTAVIDVMPTRTVMRLNTALVAPASMGMRWDDTPSGALGLIVDWPGLNPAPTTPINFAVTLPAEHLTFGSDDAKLTLTDLSGTGALAAQTVDFFRYGTL